MRMQRALKWLEQEWSAEREKAVQLERPGWGTYIAFVKGMDGNVDYFQKSYRMEDFGEFLIDVEHWKMMYWDVYGVQHRFREFNRQQLSLSWLCSCYVDLDVYKLLGEDWELERVLEGLLKHCDETKTPYPSVIISSGRGLYMKWYLKDGGPARALPKWDRIQEALVSRFLMYGADRQARDASRVLRVLGTVNQKNWGKVRVVWVCDCVEEEVKRYTLREMGDAVLPYTQEEYEAWKRKGVLRQVEEQAPPKLAPRKLVGLKCEEGWERVLPAVQLSFSQRGRHVFEDLWRLAEIRGWNKTGIPDGQRATFMLWLCNHVALSLNGSSKARVYQEVACFLKSLVPHWTMSKLHGELHAVYKRSKAMMEPSGWVEYQGKLYPLLYTPKNASLVSWLGITDEELIQLDYIRTEETRAEQTKRKRREQGMLEREEYLSNARERKEKANSLRGLGWSLDRVGKELGISKKAAQRLLSKR